MTTEQERAFNDWWNTWYKSSSDITVKEAARESWAAAMEYSENKSDKIYRWNGVIT
jgi:hypothetical protein